jgi:phospholipid/cholesterol/gamma-HCH transport system substrate-binding protein
MRKVIAGSLRDVIAIVLLTVLGLATVLVILSQQKASLPGWVPVLGEDFFELRAEFLPAQAVTPGQGQAIDIAGIQVGKVSSVDLENGRAVVGMDVEPKYAPLITDDATLLLRPKTGLADMVIEVDPGKGGREVKEGSTIPLARSQPNINVDQILATLDADTRDYLTLLLQGGAEGLGGKSKGRLLSAGLRRFEPTARDLAEINGALAERRRNIARVIHNFRLLMGELGANDQALAEFVSSSNAVFQAFGNQQASIRASLQQLPSTLNTTRSALASAGQLSREMQRSLPKLIPAAQALKPGLEAAQRLFTDTTPPIRDQIRPFTRQVRRPVKHLTQTGPPLGKTINGLSTGLGSLNYGLNELAFNPSGPAEGFLFYLGWLNHTVNNVYLTQDAGGPLRHGMIVVSCATAQLAPGIVAGKPFLKTLQQITNFPSDTVACN